MSKELVEKKNDLITRADCLLNKAKEEKRELTEAEAEELAEIRDNVRRIVKHLDLEKEFKDMEEKKVIEEKPVEIEVDKEVQETRAFEHYIRSMCAGRVVERDTAHNLTFSDNGAVVPVTIAKRIIKKVYDMSPILERSSKYNIKGTFQIPYYDETNSAITVAWADEFTELTSQIGKFTSITLTGYLAGALALISRSLLNNTEFDIVGFVVDEMAYKIHLFIENALLNGAVNGDDETTVAGLSGLTNSLTASSTNAITANELIELQAKVKDLFQPNAIWIMSPATRTAIRELKDNMGRYLLQDDISLPWGKNLLGKPVYVSDNMDDIGAGKTVIYYGDMKGLATKFSEDINIEVLRERFATMHAYGVVGWIEFDSKVQDQQMIAKLVMATASV